MQLQPDVQESGLLGCGESDHQVCGTTVQGGKGDSSFRKYGGKETEKTREGQKDLTKVSFLSKKRKRGIDMISG